MILKTSHTLIAFLIMLFALASTFASVYVYEEEEKLMLNSNLFMNMAANFVADSSQHVDKSMPINETSCTNEDLSTKIWPLPKFFTKGDTKVFVSPHITFRSSKSVKTLTDAFERYKTSIFQHILNPREALKGPVLSILEVNVNNLSEDHPQLGTDESYTLEISLNGKGKLNAETIYGILHGLETFSQLIYFDYDTETYSISESPWMIQDAPRFLHRGVMIDTSRHFLPLNTIRNIIDSLVMAKLNVLHWHMTDDNSFPIQTHSHPELWKGSWTPSERYLQTDIANVVEYARARGIRIMLEIDVPSHTTSWCKGIPSLCPSLSCPVPLNVANENVFHIIEDILKEFTGGKKKSGLFVDDLLHVGGDEVHLSCWTNSTEIMTWLKQRNMTEMDGLKYFIDRVDKIAEKFERRPVHWVDVYDSFKTKINPNAIIHVWLDKISLQHIVNDGYDAILSNNHECYLDYLNTPWETFYLNEPLENITSIEAQKHVLGGQTEMWGETVDASNIYATIWPRTAAYAERLWSPSYINDTICALPRLKWFRCQMLFRGFGAAPVTNKRARDAPLNFDTCLV